MPIPNATQPAIERGLGQVTIWWPFTRQRVPVAFAAFWLAQTHRPDRPSFRCLLAQPDASGVSE